MDKDAITGKKQEKTIRRRIAHTVGNIVYVNFTLIAMVIFALAAYCAGTIV